MNDMEGASLGPVSGGWVAANLIGKPLLAIRETRASIAKALVQYEKDDTAVPTFASRRLVLVGLIRKTPQKKEERPICS